MVRRGNASLLTLLLPEGWDVAAPVSDVQVDRRLFRFLLPVTVPFCAGCRGPFLALTKQCKSSLILDTTLWYLI